MHGLRSVLPYARHSELLSRDPPSFGLLEALRFTAQLHIRHDVGGAMEMNECKPGGNVTQGEIHILKSKTSQ